MFDKLIINCHLKFAKRNVSEFRFVQKKNWSNFFICSLLSMRVEPLNDKNRKDKVIMTSFLCVSSKWFFRLVCFCLFMDHVKSRHSQQHQFSYLQVILFFVKMIFQSKWNRNVFFLWSKNDIFCIRNKKNGAEEKRIQKVPYYDWLNCLYV